MTPAPEADLPPPPPDQHQKKRGLFAFLHLTSLRLTSLRFGSLRLASLRFSSLRLDSLRFDSLRGLLDSLWNRTLSLSASPRASWWLGGLSFIEGIFFPLPCEALLLPMCLARPKRALFFAAIVTLSSVAGGLVGWFLGVWAYESLALPLINALGVTERFNEARALYRDWGAWFVFMGGFTPFPYKVIALSSGAAGMPLLTFVVFSLLSRGVRFYIEAILLRIWGDSVRRFIDSHLPWVSLAGLAVVFGLVLLLLH